MGLIKSKQQKEIEKRMLVKKTLNEMQRYIQRLEDQKKVYVEAAKKAKANGLDAQVNLAVTGLKMTMAQQKRAQEMLLNFEIVSQMKDMTAMVHEFLGSLDVLSKEMTKLTDSKEFIKVQEQFETAMNGVQTQENQMDVFLDMSQTEFNSLSADGSTVSDDEIDKLVNEQASQDSLSQDMIDKELGEISKKIKSRE